MWHPPAREIKMPVRLARNSTAPISNFTSLRRFGVGHLGSRTFSPMPHRVTAPIARVVERASWVDAAHERSLRSPCPPSLPKLYRRAITPPATIPTRTHSSDSRHARKETITMNRAHDNVRLLPLAGDYDISDKETLAALFGALAPDGAVVIDMTKVTYIDSTFLNQIDALRLRLKRHCVTLLGVNKQARRLLTIVNFDHLFQIVEA
jgi:anti-anti-sigma factor